MEHHAFGLFPQDSSGWTRRQVLRAGALTALMLAGGSVPKRATGYAPANVPFSLGVASGDPTHDSVLLWTRLATDPLNGGGMAPEPIEVRWTVATDPHMHHVVRRGATLALPANAHSVHLRVNGLAPDRWYWYRFTAGSTDSPIGRTRTVPAPDSQPRELRFAFVSCQNYEAGYYTALQNLAEEEIDFVIHLGDYIYDENDDWRRVRAHFPNSEPAALEDYRHRHAQYRLDPYLQAAHARFPFFVSWDDHEVEDNYADLVSTHNADLDTSNDVSEPEFRQRLSAAYKAFFEHMPIDPQSSTASGALRLYRKCNWGRLAEICLLDTRQYRTTQPCRGANDRIAPIGDDIVVPCGEELAENATITGDEQERWIIDSLRHSRARWNVIAQQVMMASVDFGPGVGTFDSRFAGTQVRNVDAWDGYVAARNRLLGAVRDNAVQNVIVLSGDVHSSWVNELKADFTETTSPVVATEFVGPSVTSHFPTTFLPVISSALADPANNHVKFFEGTLHGYVRCHVTPERWRSDYRVVDTVARPNANVRTLKSFLVNDRDPAAAPVEAVA